MDANLQVQALVVALGAEIAHRLTHADRGCDGAVRRLECCHHGVANCLHDGAPFGRDDFQQQPEMLVDEIECNEVAYPLIELGRVLEIAEKEGKAQDLEALSDGQRVGLIDVAESLIGEQPLRGKYGLASLQEVFERLVRYPYGRQYSTVGAVLQGQTQRSRVQDHGIDWDLHLVEDHGQVLALAHLLAPDIQKLGSVRHWVEDDYPAFRQLQREDCPSPWRQLDPFECDLLQH